MMRQRGVSYVGLRTWTFNMKEFFNRGYTRNQYEEMGGGTSFLLECQKGGNCFMESSLKEPVGY